MLTPGPAARPALTFLELFLGAPNPARSGGLLLGILDPADELVARQGRYVLPNVKRRGAGEQSLAQVPGQFMYHPAGHSLGAHTPIVVSAVGPSLVGMPRCGRRQEESASRAGGHARPRTAYTVAAISLHAGSGTRRCGASDADVPTAIREVHHSNNQEKCCPSVGAVREAEGACCGRYKATGYMRDRKGTQVAVLPWIDQALHAGSRWRRPPAAKASRSGVLVGCAHRVSVALIASRTSNRTPRTPAQSRR